MLNDAKNLHSLLPKPHIYDFQLHVQQQLNQQELAIPAFQPLPMLPELGGAAVMLLCCAMPYYARYYHALQG